jgi:hypothetical protein
MDRERGRDRCPFGLEFTGGDGISLASSSQGGRRSPDQGLPKWGGGRPFSQGLPPASFTQISHVVHPPSPPLLTAGRAWEQVVYSWDWNIQFERSHRGGTTSTVAAVCTRPRRPGARGGG